MQGLNAFFTLSSGAVEPVKPRTYSISQLRKFPSPHSPARARDPPISPLKKDRYIAIQSVFASPQTSIGSVGNRRRISSRNQGTGSLGSIGSTPDLGLESRNSDTAIEDSSSEHRSSDMARLHPSSAVLMTEQKRDAMRLAKQQEEAVRAKCTRNKVEFPPYVFEEMIGKGSFGRVYRW